MAKLDLLKLKLLLLAAFILNGTVYAQQVENAALTDIKKFQEELNAEYKDPELSPLPEEVRANFQGHAFFPADLNFRVEAKLKKVAKAQPLKITTTKGQQRDYLKYGMLHFKIGGKAYKLAVYQSADLLKKAEYKDYLFLPFTDLTNGEETYGGGRFIDLRIPEGGKLILDFNKAYNPYCAYSTRYSCPIPPKENFLDLKVLAGVKSAGGEH